MVLCHVTKPLTRYVGFFSSFNETVELYFVLWHQAAAGSVEMFWWASVSAEAHQYCNDHCGKLQQMTIFRVMLNMTKLQFTTLFYNISFLDANLNPIKICRGLLHGISFQPPQSKHLHKAEENFRLLTTDSLLQMFCLGLNCLKLLISCSIARV